MATDTQPITSNFDQSSTAEEVAAGIDLGGRRAVVTGGASGIGVETARALARRGATVTLAVRNLTIGRQVADDIAAATGNQLIDVRPLELADLSSVAAFVQAWDGPLDILVNNAGVMGLKERILTPGGVEMHFATNHLGHFALSVGLHRALAAAGGARIVSLSSSAHLRCPVLFDDPSFAFVAYDPFLGYGQSKTANALFAVDASRRWVDDGITVNAVMPGGIATNLQRHFDPEVLAQARRDAGAGTIMKTVQQGAATSVFVATSPQLDGIGGHYFEDCNQAQIVHTRADSDGRHGVAPFALDPANAERLWDLSIKLTEN